jgi:heterodisulfide reductase subunit C
MIDKVTDVVEMIKKYAIEKEFSISVKKVVVDENVLLIIYTNNVNEIQKFISPFENEIDIILVDETYKFNYLAI